MWGRKAQRIAALESLVEATRRELAEARDALAVSETMVQHMSDDALKADAERDRLATLLAKELSK